MNFHVLLADLLRNSLALGLRFLADPHFLTNAALLLDDRFFTPHEAVEYGLIDRVLNGNGARREG